MDLRGWVMKEAVTLIDAGVAVGLAIHRVVLGLFGLSRQQYQQSQVDPKKPLLKAIKDKIYDASKSRHHAFNLFGDSEKLDELEDDHFIEGKWKELDINILVEIIQSFNILELTSSSIAHKTCDLTMSNSNYIVIPMEPYIYVDSRSDKMLTRVLKIALSLSQGNIITLIFHFDQCPSDDQLIYTAARCPRLKRLVLLSWNRIKKSEICRIFRMWKDLESLIIHHIGDPSFFMSEIAKNCKNFYQLKITGPCDLSLAHSLVAFLPNLKVLSLRCSIVSIDSLIFILDRLKQLEVLNISHCVLIEVPFPFALNRVIKKLDGSILEKASQLRKFFRCMKDSCILCQRTKNDVLMKWHRYEEVLWKANEVESLALRIDHTESVVSGCPPPLR
ncbi:hypothetical protein L1049_021170 [Liquidambar formosana]|uniref:F-box/LRR-repeat protein n=1 Tax=Liquidambar formosana TaxID=63359 RepID=A0AAP0S961_LIQFO